MSITLVTVLLILGLACFLIEAFHLLKQVTLGWLGLGLAFWVLAVMVGASHLIVGAAPAHLVAYLAVDPASPVAPIDAATLASIILGLILLPLLKRVPLDGNKMIAVTWGATFVAALIAVVAVDQLQGISFSLPRLLVDFGLAYGVQAGGFTAAKHNVPALVTEAPARAAPAAPGV